MPQITSRIILHGIARGAFAIGLVTVAVLMLTPGEALPETGVWDKFEHALVFAGLGLLGAWAFGDQHRWWLLPSGLIAFGGACESLQMLVPGRSPSLADGLADAIGVLAAAGLVMLWRCAWSRRQRSAA